MPQTKRHNVLSPPQPRRAARELCWARLYGGAKALALAALAEQGAAPLVVITADTARAMRLLAELGAYLSEPERAPVITFPDWEILPYDLFSPYQDIVSQRLETLAALPAFRRGILVAPVTTVMQRLLPADYLRANSLLLEVGQTLTLKAFKDRLQRQGYRFVEQVSEHGEVRGRGALLDIFPMGARRPYRIDLLDDEIDSIRTFDVETQRSIEKIGAIRVLPAREVPLDAEGIARFRGNWRARFAGNPGQCPIYRDVSQGLAPAGVEYYLPLFYEQTGSLFDYLRAETVLALDEGVAEAAEAFQADIKARYEQRSHQSERPVLPPEALFLAGDELAAGLARFARFSIGQPRAGSGVRAIEYDTAMPTGLPVDPRAPAPLRLVRRFLAEFDGRVLIAAESQGRRETIMELFEPREKPARVEGWAQFLAGDMPFGIAVLPVDQGLILPGAGLAVLSEAQLFAGRAEQRRRRRRKSQDAEAVIRNLTELNPGAPVVHEEHGVGRYLGLATLDTGGIPAEFIQLEYAEGDRLYVPVAALGLISRYTGVNPEHAPLHKLGGGQWQKAKQKAARRAFDVAAELLELQARRAAREGRACQLDEAAYRAFARHFPFEETPGQQDAIEAVLRDLCQARPMDRLVCGDAGFGKTEVAMRAAFIVVQNHRQVAVLAPTTLLAQQHYQNFTDRFADWPVRVELLSRFRSKKELAEARAAIAGGQADIVIGTHKLLQADLRFKNPGLLVIDEEHRFGVRQKERFKSLRAEIDVLTLTATPIPRTLNMALSDLRELSIIATPPSRRLAVKTCVLERDDSLLKEALLREIKRGGQVFYLHNEVRSIERAAAGVLRLLPEARVRVAHGQMPEKQLEAVMLDFYHRRFNVLVCTTIIETGIDVPTANTIIIERADKFGLAQLYQLRGRVGRSHHRAYAYLIAPPRQAMTADAVKRLEAIEALEELGIGFTLATHDLEIRGAGEILGEGQSGHIQAIGFGLYMEFLGRAVAALKSGRQPELDRPLDHGVEIDLHAPALIPAEFLPDVQLRLIMYKRIASAGTDAELWELREEMIDRFGLLPDAARTLFEISRLKLRAGPLGVRKIDLGASGGRIFFAALTSIDPGRIIRLLQADPQSYRLDGQDKLRIRRDLPELADRLRLLEDLLGEIAMKNAA